MSNVRTICTSIALSFLAACSSLERAPSNHISPWMADNSDTHNHIPKTNTKVEKTKADSGNYELNADKTSSNSYYMPKVELPDIEPVQLDINPDQELNLAQLIDIAQRENPLTRTAWNAARSAAIGVGLVEATFLPQISANVITGQMRNHYPLKYPVLGHDAIDTKTSDTVPFLALTWLLFDFGQRASLLEAAEHISFASNVLFNASHQKVIRDVTDQYYQYSAAKERVKVAKQAVKLQQEVLNAANTRYQGGLGTTLDVALAKQAVSQAKLHLVNSQGLEKTSYLELLAAMGLPADTRLNIANNHATKLPPANNKLTEQALKQALAQRPDVISQYANMRAAQANVKAAEADFLPKVFLGAVYGKQRNNFQLGNLPGFNLPSSGNAIALGVSLPIFDGGIRRNNLRTSEIAAEQATNDLQSAQKAAIREMVIAETVLQSSLQSHDTANELVNTAHTAYNGAFEAYKQGLGTITVATEAATQLLQAKQARVDAYNAALIAAANLAFVTGNMVQAPEN